MQEYPWRDVYIAVVVKFGVNPSDYWQMSPDEVSLFLKGNKPTVHYGFMSEDDVDELIEMSNGEGFI